MLHDSLLIKIWLFQIMGGSVSRDNLRVRDSEVAAGERGPGAGQHRLCGGWPPAGVPHHRLQQPGRQDSRCAARTARWGSKDYIEFGPGFKLNSQDADFVRIFIAGLNLCVAGTRIGQASECFVYWKDPSTSDTWGLNFTSPIDAKQFRECCVSCQIINYEQAYIHLIGSKIHSFRHTIIHLFTI